MTSLVANGCTIVLRGRRCYEGWDVRVTKPKTLRAISRLFTRCGLHWMRVPRCYEWWGVRVIKPKSVRVITWLIIRCGLQWINRNISTYRPLSLSKLFHQEVYVRFLTLIIYMQAIPAHLAAHVWGVEYFHLWRMRFQQVLVVRKSVVTDLIATNGIMKVI